MVSACCRWNCSDHYRCLESAEFVAKERFKRQDFKKKLCVYNFSHHGVYMGSSTILHRIRLRGNTHKYLYFDAPLRIVILEMFLSKSNLIGIANNCKESQTYMFCFAFIHASALTISTLFAVLCFGKRIQYWYIGFKWKFIGSDGITNVFGDSTSVVCLGTRYSAEQRQEGTLHLY